jgi:hypothetical protein
MSSFQPKNRKVYPQICQDTLHQESGLGNREKITHIRGLCSFCTLPVASSSPRTSPKASPRRWQGSHLIGYCGWCGSQSELKPVSRGTAPAGPPAQGQGELRRTIRGRINCHIVAPLIWGEWQERPDAGCQHLSRACQALHDAASRRF